MEKRPPTEEDLASFEGKYPKDLFNKSVIASDNQTLIGHVAKETDDLIVVFSESDNSRFDIPKSQITLVGGSVVVSVENLSSYKVDKDAPLPESKSLRPSAEEILTKAAQEPRLEEEEEEKQEEQQRPEEYISGEKSEIVGKVKAAANELKEVVQSGAKMAGEKVKEVQQIAAEKQAETDTKEIAKGVANELKEVVQSGAKMAGEKVKEVQQIAAEKQAETEEQMAAENISKIEELAKRPRTEEDLASFEGKYPKDLFNKSVIASDNQTLIGHVAKETDDLIVVFSESDNSRFDIPKSQITLVGGSVVVSVENLSSYKVDKDAPLPESKSLRPSAEEILTKAAQEPRIEEEEEQQQQRPEEYVSGEKSEIVGKVKDVANEL